MSFATDRDLLVLEPNVFRDIGFASQRLAKGSDGVITGTSLYSPTCNFVDSQVTTGHVIVVESIPYEVIECISEHTLTISRLRSDPNGVPIIPVSGISLTFEIMSFTPQLEMVHLQIMRTIGIDMDYSDGELTEDDIINYSDFIPIEAIGALHILFAGASSLIGDNGTLWGKAELYKKRFETARSRVKAMIDIDGDGRADTVRYLNVVQFIRG